MGKLKQYLVKAILICIPFMASALGVDELRENYTSTNCKECTASASGSVAISSLLEERVEVPSDVRHMEQLEEAIAEQGLKARAYYATVMTPKDFSKAVQSTLKDENSVMIVQYEESHTDMHTGTTFALVTNFDPKIDSVQLMSVNAKEHKFKWVKSSALVKAMQVLDENHCPKGYLLVRKPLPDEN